MSSLKLKDIWNELEVGDPFIVEGHVPMIKSATDEFAYDGHNRFGHIIISQEPRYLDYSVEDYISSKSSPQNAQLVVYSTPPVNGQCNCPSLLHGHFPECGYNK